MPSPTFSTSLKTPGILNLSHRDCNLRQASSRCRINAAFHVFSLPICMVAYMLQTVTADTFSQEIAEAMKAYDKYVICIDKTPEEFHASLLSLLNKAIKAYENRGPQLRHGIALDRQVTVILSQNESDRPLCGIYFNLHSPYQKAATTKVFKAVREPIGGTSED
jgi:hypothetical protein